MQGLLQEVSKNEDNYCLVGLGQVVECPAQFDGPEVGHSYVQGGHEAVVELAGEERIGKFSKIELQNVGGQVWAFLSQFIQGQIRIF